MYKESLRKCVVKGKSAIRLKAIRLDFEDIRAYLKFGICKCLSHFLKFFSRID